VDQIPSCIWDGFGNIVEDSPDLRHQYVLMEALSHSNESNYYQSEWLMYLLF
jgi:hypothetical protein